MATSSRGGSWKQAVFFPLATLTSPCHCQNTYDVNTISTVARQRRFKNRFQIKAVPCLCGSTWAPSGSGSDISASLLRYKDTEVFAPYRLSVDVQLGWFLVQLLPISPLCAEHCSKTHCFVNENVRYKSEAKVSEEHPHIPLPVFHVAQSFVGCYGDGIPSGLFNSGGKPRAAAVITCLASDVQVVLHMSNAKENPWFPPRYIIYTIAEIIRPLFFQLYYNSSTSFNLTSFFGGHPLYKCFLMSTPLWICEVHFLQR